MPVAAAGRRSWPVAAGAHSTRTRRLNGIEGKRPGRRRTQGPVEGKLTISQWPLYIDPGKNGTIAEFERDTGVDVNYIEDINDNAEFFGKMQPLLPGRVGRPRA